MISYNDKKKLVIDMIHCIGDDPNREGLLETPDRVIRSWEELYSGYNKNPEDVFKVFENPGYDQMVLSKNINFFSTCEHHNLQFFGKAHIAYIPNGKVIGISKLSRLLEIYARRLQIQERIGEQVTDALMKYLEPKGAACIIQAQHMCMMARGVKQQDSTMITSSLKGCFLESSVKQELFSMIRL